MAICRYCKMRYAEYPPEDYILDLPSPPGKGIIPKNDEAYERRMNVFWNDEEGDCGCSEQGQKFLEPAYKRYHYL